MLTPSKTTVVRLDSLDYLRGLAALGIMVYHMLSWTYGVPTADTFMGRVGIYGVSIFYVLSGLTLQHVYFEEMVDFRAVRRFFVRRVFRIFPLLWLVTFAAIFVAGTVPNLFDLFLNLTGLFGFAAWDTYFATGAWSIGNELVFYAFFPLIVLAARMRYGLVVLGILFGGTYATFAFIVLSPHLDLGDQWSNYVNPLNQVFLFYCGFLIGHLLRRVSPRRLVVHLAFWGALAGFVFWPTGAESIEIVTGWNRIAFTIFCVVLCAAVYKLLPDPWAPVHRAFITLGHISYAVYLLHPIIYGILDRAGTIEKQALAAVTIVLTVAAAYASYRWLEMPLNRWGRRVSFKV